MIGRTTSDEQAFHRGANMKMCKHNVIYNDYGVMAVVFASMVWTSINTKAADNPPTIGSAKAAWHAASARFDFVMDEQTLSIKPSAPVTDEKVGDDAQVRCILVVPKRAVPGNPWSWRDLHRKQEPPAETELLSRGFHLAYITPGPLRQRDAWHAFLTQKYRLARKPVEVGMSTAGELRVGTAKVSITPEDAKKPRPRQGLRAQPGARR